jgi:L-seryl-tRNA(Ser) seleniumtransferase
MAPDAITAWLESRTLALTKAHARPSLRRVINATGVIIHTNLGRAPLAEAAVKAAALIATGYSNLEFDLDRGDRGHRHVHAERLLCSLTGAEAAVIVNNAAAAALLALKALGAGREVIVSRGELVEIGGGFRVPEILAQSGAILREVGTTNRTRISGLRGRHQRSHGLILRVHPSNFQIQGFTERPSLPDLVALARRFNIRSSRISEAAGWASRPRRNRSPTNRRCDPAWPRASIWWCSAATSFSAVPSRASPSAGAISSGSFVAAR